MTAQARTAALLPDDARPRYPVAPTLAPPLDQADGALISPEPRPGTQTTYYAVASGRGMGRKQPRPGTQTTYYAVLFTQPWHGEPSTKWAEALRLLATLAEESPGYLGYDVEEMDGGREYAVTHWTSPAHIRQWKKSSALLIGDNGLLDRISDQEGCFWPWLDKPQAV